MGAIEVKIPQGQYDNEDAVEKVIKYICRINNPVYIGGIGLYPMELDSVIEQFYTIKRIYNNLDGKQILHIIFSFQRCLGFNPKNIMDMAYQIAAYWGNDRQVVFAIHDDTKHIHIHMGVNTVAYSNGSYKSYFQIKSIKQFAESIIQERINKKWLGKE